MPLPASLQTLIEAVDAVERDAASLIDGLSDADVNRQPAPGSWSIAQNLHHIAVTNEFYLRGFVERVREAHQAQGGPFNGLSPSWVGRWFVRSLEPPPKFKVKTFPSVVPAERFDRDALLPVLTASHAGYRALVEASATVDVNRIIVRNPFQRQLRMRLSTILLVIPAHGRRHIWQTQNVRRALGLRT